MEYQGIKKIHSGKFIHRYDIRYRTAAGREKIYEMVSRNPQLDSLADLRRPRADAVVLLLTDKTEQHLLLLKEFRMATGCWVYNLPAGLLEPGEDCPTAAARELKEETGLTLLDIVTTLPLSYSAPGFTNECNVTLIGHAAGEFTPSTSDEEEIVPGWYSREQVRQLLQSEAFSARAQTAAYLWSLE